MDNSKKRKFVCSTEVRPIKPPPLLQVKKDQILKVKIYTVVKAWNLSPEEFHNIPTESLQNMRLKGMQEKLLMIQKLLQFCFEWQRQWSTTHLSTKLKILKCHKYCFERVFYLLEIGYKAENYQICSLLLMSKDKFGEQFPEIRRWAAKQLGVEDLYQEYIQYQNSPKYKLQQHTCVDTDTYGTSDQEQCSQDKQKKQIIQHCSSFQLPLSSQQQQQQQQQQQLSYLQQYPQQYKQQPYQWQQYFSQQQQKQQCQLLQHYRQQYQQQLQQQFKLYSPQQYLYQLKKQQKQRQQQQQRQQDLYYLQQQPSQQQQETDSLQQYQWQHYCSKQRQYQQLQQSYQQQQQQPQQSYQQQQQLLQHQQQILKHSVGQSQEQSNQQKRGNIYNEAEQQQQYLQQNLRHGVGQNQGQSNFQRKGNINNEAEQQIQQFQQCNNNQLEVGVSQASNTILQCTKIQPGQSEQLQVAISESQNEINNDMTVKNSNNSRVNHSSLDKFQQLQFLQQNSQNQQEYQVSRQYSSQGQDSFLFVSNQQNYKGQVLNQKQLFAKDQQEIVPSSNNVILDQQSGREVLKESKLSSKNKSLFKVNVLYNQEIDKQAQLWRSNSIQTSNPKKRIKIDIAQFVERV